MVGFTTAFSCTGYDIAVVAGLLAFPNLLCLPGPRVSGVILTSYSKGDYSCRNSSGFSPDSLTSRLVLEPDYHFGGKDTTFLIFCVNKLNIFLFLHR